MVTSADPQTDGRIQRSERSREAIVQAMLDLIAEGELAPTAQQVAVRADVGVRTVFRHFSDMESLYAAMNDAIQLRHVDGFTPGTPEAAFAKRLEGLLDQRFALLESLAPYIRASARPRVRSAFLREQHDRDVRAFRKNMLGWLPELADAEPAVVHAFELTLSFEAWNRLRIDQKLSVRKAQEALRTIATALAATLDL